MENNMVEDTYFKVFLLSTVFALAPFALAPAAVTLSIPIFSASLMISFFIGSIGVVMSVFMLVTSIFRR